MSHSPTDNFIKTLAQLKSYCSTPIVDDRDRSGIIQGFEFTFEQAWKSIQKITPSLGIQVASPKQAFQAALQLGWIQNKDEPTWIKMMEDRNSTSHTYKEDLAKEVLTRISNHYISLFEELLINIQKHSKIKKFPAFP